MISALSIFLVFEFSTSSDETRRAIGAGLANMSGDFTVVNTHLVRDLKARGLWDEVMVSDLKYFDGALGENPFPWMSEVMDLKKEKNFFETRVIEYQNGGALSWE